MASTKEHALADVNKVARLVTVHMQQTIGISIFRKQDREPNAKFTSLTQGLAHEVVVVETWRLGPLEKGLPSKR